MVAVTLCPGTNNVLEDSEKGCSFDLSEEHAHETVMFNRFVPRSLIAF